MAGGHHCTFVCDKSQVRQLFGVEFGGHRQAWSARDGLWWKDEKPVVSVEVGLEAERT